MRSLISVYNKKGIVDFARNLSKLGWELITTGGTYKYLRSAKIKSIPVEKITGEPEIFDGRVKTISYKIAAGILFDRSSKMHNREMKKLRLQPIDMVVCNLYPFSQTVAKKDSLEEAIEMIDIGGVTALRAAAKNYKNVIVICDQHDYQKIINEILLTGDVSLDNRSKLAYKAFQTISIYDASISEYLAKKFGFGANLNLSFSNGIQLRYGENTHLSGWYYRKEDADNLSLSKFKKLRGKELSFNNILDISSCIDTLSELGKDPSCVVVKHTNPSGASTAKSVEEAYKKAWHGGDPLAAFGGIVAVNRMVDKKLSLEMLREGKFFEVLIAPQITKSALSALSERKNLIILINANLRRPKIKSGDDYKFVRGGILKQDFDSKKINSRDLKVVTIKKPTNKQLEDMLFAWKIVKVSKSNAVAIVKNQTLIASGVGQQDRKEACRLAVFKAMDTDRGKSGETPKEAAAASDGFFPFADGPEILIKAGIKAIIQPGGSKRDQETIDLCNKYNITMAFTSIRAFRH